MKVEFKYQRLTIRTDKCTRKVKKRVKPGWRGCG